MESETKENNLSLSLDEEDVNLKNDTKPDVNNIIKLEGDNILNVKETVTVDKESYEKFLLTEGLCELVTSEEFLKNVRERAKYEDKSLHIASAMGKLDLVKKLVELGHDVNMKNNEKKTPLYFAVEKNHLSIVMYLVEKNACTNTQDNKDCTPLHIAVKNGNLSIVKYLVENNAFIDVQDDENCWTPLHWAVYKNNPEIVEYLCSQKDSSHLRSKSKQARTPLALARQWSQLECIKIIENRLKF